MIVILTTALILSAGALALVVLVRDSAKLLSRHGEWKAELARFDRAALRDPAAFSLRPAADATRGVPVRPSAPRRLSAAA